MRRPAGAKGSGHRESGGAAGLTCPWQRGEPRNAVGVRLNLCLGRAERVAAVRVNPLGSTHTCKGAAVAPVFWKRPPSQKCLQNQGGCFDVGTIFGKERSWKYLPWAPDPSGFEKTLNWLTWLTGGVRRLRFGIAPRPKPRPIGPRRDVGLAGWGQGREARGAAGRLFDTDRLTLTDQK